MLEDSSRSADIDMELRALREEQVEAERTALATQSALDADGNLLTDAERSEMELLLIAVREKALGSDRIAIKKASDALSKGTEAFAARRMDQSVRKVLAGKSISEIA